MRDTGSPGGVRGKGARVNRVGVRVLLVEDDAADAELLLHELRRSGFEPEWERVYREHDFREALRRRPLPDVILSDYTMPTFSGLKALRMLRELGVDVPFLVVTGTIGEDVAVECMREGAADYLLKDRLTRLGPAVGRALEEHVLRRARRAAEDALRERLQFEEFLTEHSARMIHARLDEMDATIAGTLRALAENVGFHRAHILSFDEARERVSIYSEWSAPSVSKLVLRDPWIRHAGWPVTAVSQGERIVVYRADLERHAAALRGFVDDGELESLILLPLAIEGVVVGAIGFQRRRERASRPPSVETSLHFALEADSVVLSHRYGALEGRLNLVVEMVANALARKRAEERRQAAFQELARLKQAAEHERDYLREEIQVGHGSGIVGTSPAMTRVLDLVRAVASTKATVLVRGESGVGKELIARAIHAESSRATGPLVKVNCASIPKELFESEFFGHVKGSFTGAHKNRLGRFELADGGTLFLDEVGEIPLEMQAKFLRVLQESEFERVGDDRTRRVDVRIVAATNRDLEAEAHAGKFRSDLYYRLGVFPIEVPPLRARREDVIPLAKHFLSLRCRELGRPELTLDAEQSRLLERYDWPGNVRELSHVLERAVILSEGRKLSLEMALNVSAPPASVVVPESGVILREDELRNLERSNIVSALEKAEWRISGASGAAELLGIRPSTLRDRMKALGVQKQA